MHRQITDHSRSCHYCSNDNGESEWNPLCQYCICGSMGMGWERNAGLVWTKKIKKYMEEFQSKGINSVILDLRNNTGGVVEEAVKISELFIDKGNTVLRSYNKTEKETIIKSSSGKYKDINLVVLVNDYSASASEIVTAALKDNKAATIVGIKTYGKGVMQEIQPLFDGAIKITIEEFKTPNGDKINKVGIKPDVEIEIDKDSNEDLQLQKAIEILK